MPIKIIVSQFNHRFTANTNNKLCFVSVVVCVYIHFTCVPCKVLCLHFLFACPCIHKQVPSYTVAILVTLFAYSCKHLHQDVVPVAVVLEQHNVGRSAKINVACFPLHDISLTLLTYYRYSHESSANKIYPSASLGLCPQNLCYFASTLLETLASLHFST